MKAELLEKATEAMNRAYAPYSGFSVGAALLAKSGKIYTGCNIENAAYPDSCCAERTAIFKAVSEGERAFEAIAIVADANGAVSPCGSCRQVMSEFFAKDTTVHMANLRGEERTATMAELLPFSFDSDQMQD